CCTLSDGEGEAGVGRWLMAVVRVLGLSHISFHVGSSEALCRELRGRYGFRLWGSRVTASAEQQVLRKGSAVFIVNQRPGGRPRARAQASAWPSPSGGFLYDVAPAPGVDTAANVCFEVRRVEEAARRLSGLGCRVLVPPRRVEGEGGLGPVTYTVLRSALGNVCHTLVDRSAYSGDFLFIVPISGTASLNLSTSPPPSPPSRPVSRPSSLTVLQPNLHFHSPYPLDSKAQVQTLNCPNQVDTFLQQHHGAGIQHVGLYTTDIVSTSKCLMDNGVQFFFPPPAYYTEHRSNSYLPSGISLFVSFRYLMQVFTKPLFSEDTFFLELIERKGAAGFGEGNIQSKRQESKEENLKYPLPNSRKII
uniref:4-hydroxyphenylpyruvate dioxygenase-like n=1 Tax=Callorhinchus milii TaxID=7868 RepID=A0A4W3I556_CALMI